jgi:transposase InsO family protein
MADMSSRPRRSPNRTNARTERRLLALRFSRRWGPHRIAAHLHLPARRWERSCPGTGMPRLACLDQGTGLPVRKPARQRYEHDYPGDLIHVDIKKLGRIPQGGGHRALGRARGRRNRRAGTGYNHVHHAVDDHSRLAYSEILTDEKKETATAFWLRTAAFFAAHGITVKAVLTDNGACYRSRAFAAALGPHIKHRRTRPYRPRTNGKVERFNRTIATEWAYARPYTSETDRAAPYPDWLHQYNHHRTHTGIGGKTPISRVHNLSGNYT